MAEQIKAPATAEKAGAVPAEKAWQTKSGTCPQTEITYKKAERLWQQNTAAVR